MPIVLTPITPAPVTDAYLTPEAARALAAGVMATPGMSKLLALTDDGLGMALYTASIDIDVAMRYQGRKYPSADGVTEQVREFPRVAYSSGLTPGSVSATAGGILGGVVGGGGGQVWDWDSENNVAVVPQNVKLACLFQAAWLQVSSHTKRIEEINSGVAQASIGTAGETMNPAAEGVRTKLGARAAQLMEKYRIRTGQLL